MITRRPLTALLACAFLVVFAGGAIFLVQLVSEEPEPHLLTLDAPPTGLRPGKVILSLSSAMVTLAAGSLGEPLRVESSFDPDVYTLEQQYQEGDDRDWVYRLDFHEKSVFHISVVRIWLGKRSPKVTLLIPPQLSFDLEATMEGGYLVMDFANLGLATADVELDRGLLQITASEPMNAPMNKLGVRGRTGTMFLNRIGNASPQKLEVRHGLGAARVDLRGRWRTDADIDFRVDFADGELHLPRNVRIDGMGRSLGAQPDREVPLPTLRIRTTSRIGDIREAF